MSEFGFAVAEPRWFNYRVLLMSSSTGSLPRLIDVIGDWLLPRAQNDSQDESNETLATTGGGFEQKPVIVWSAPHPLEARIVKGRLESAGIPAILQGEVMGDILGLSYGGLAKTDVLVPAPLAEKALEMLDIEFLDIEEFPDIQENDCGTDTQEND